MEKEIGVGKATKTRQKGVRVGHEGYHHTFPRSPAQGQNPQIADDSQLIIYLPSFLRAFCLARTACTSRAPRRTRAISIGRFSLR